MRADAHRQRRDHRASVRRHPAFAAIADRMRAQHQVLHHEFLVTLEARAGRDLDLDEPILGDDSLRGLVATTTALAFIGRRSRLRRLLHSAPRRLDLRAALQPFQAGVFLARPTSPTFELAYFAQ